MTSESRKNQVASRFDSGFWRPRVFLGVLAIIAAGVIWVTIVVLSARTVAEIRAESEVRLALFSGNVMSELRRSSIVPQLLARDPHLTSALATGDFSQSSQRLIEYRDEIGAARLLLLDVDGRTVASSDRKELGSIHRTAPYLVNALRSNTTVFNSQLDELGLPIFTYSRKVMQGNEVLGVIVVSVDLKKYERSWAGIAEALIVTDSSGAILLTTDSRWRNKTEEEALALGTEQAKTWTALRTAWLTLSGAIDTVVHGRPVIRSEARIPFQGWRIVGYSSHETVRERVATAVAIEVMAFAILAATLFYTTSRQAERRSARLQKESRELRKLNVLLQREIAERKKAEKSLEVAEQTIAQSSKLAALGEMSAAVSHELNQPLAAMKTYLAGARLLISRKRTEEAVSSLQRINDLIDRMGAITRQLKSYASKNTETLGKVDMREAVTSSLSMMEPQLRQLQIELSVSLPEEPTLVLGDRYRMEQVIVNLLRNAVDAAASVDTPEITVLLAEGDHVSLSVLDNGDGIHDFDSLFEPFYTTKDPGDGLGLGLAISSSIVNDLGGRLIARNRPEGGALFEMQLPVYGEDSLAAQ
ncbi:ATP-binding protein [Fluviibacterium sp. DFM31]|uniref:histidine kinase n=1 Tax=Meridianimarinicoccus marinus TaxID=3231483 RepID=A0ABV3L511_9RHOB